MERHLFHGLSPPVGVLFSNPALPKMPAPAMGVLATLASTFSDGKELPELTSAMILANVLKKLRLGNNKVYTIIKVVGPCLIFMGGVYEFSHRLAFIPVMAKAIGSNLAARFTSSITVPANSTLNKDVLVWLATQGLGKNARSLTLSKSSADQSGYDSDDESDDEDEDEAEKQKPLEFIPSFGQTSFKYGGHSMTLVRKEGTDVKVIGEKAVNLPAGEGDPTGRCNLTLSCFPTFRGTEPIKEFLEHVRGFSSPQKAKVTAVYRPVDMDKSYDPCWSSTWRPSRALPVMEAAKKEYLVSDIAYYLSSQCRKFYENRGIPYRRGYLLYGPPGTGKTSFAVAMAGHFNIPIFVFSMSDSNITDQKLESLFSELPLKCVVLLEDVDSAGLIRENMSASSEASSEASSDGDSGSGSRRYVKKKGITLSGLLNCLDGPASVDGRLLCMTSNTPDSLDAALVRPGRCDVKVLFGYVVPEVSAELFTNVFNLKPDECFNNEVNPSSLHDIPTLATAFASKIPVDASITPAECQAWLLANRLDPLKAVNGADAWAAEIIETKKRGANVASFANEIHSSGSPSQLPTPSSSVSSDVDDDSDSSELDLDPYL